MKKLIFGAVVALLPLAVMAQEAESLMTVEDGYARSTNPKSGAAFMTLTNGGQGECTLQAVTTESAEKAELHTHREENGMMVMGLADPIILAPGGEHHLNRGGDHVMLIGLVKPLANGDVVTLDLDFGGCGQVTTQVTVDNDRVDAHSGH